jgi:hypothetical protein
MCNDQGAIYAVDCSKNFKVERLARVYDIVSQTRYCEITVGKDETAGADFSTPAATLENEGS